MKTQHKKHHHKTTTTEKLSHHRINTTEPSQKHYDKKNTQTTQKHHYTKTAPLPHKYQENTSATTQTPLPFRSGLWRSTKCHTCHAKANCTLVLVVFGHGFCCLLSLFLCCVVVLFMIVCILVSCVYCFFLHLEISHWELIRKHWKFLMFLCFLKLLTTNRFCFFQLTINIFWC